MSRPISDDPASDIIRLRIRPATKAKLQKKARREGLSVSAYLIECGERGLWVDVDEHCV